MKNYIEDAKRTEPDSNRYDVAAGAAGAKIRMLHASMGISTEAGELLDALKKYFFYDKELKISNIKEEVGDIFWYCALLCDELGVSFEEIAQLNIKKLKVRFPDRFTSESALNRDLVAEGQVLEGTA